jgi:two-component system LytT family response regulator
MTFAELEVILPKNKFIRIHRSYMAAVAAINRIERHQIHINDIQIPVSESYMANLSSLDKR